MNFSHMDGDDYVAFRGPWTFPGSVPVKVLSVPRRSKQQAQQFVLLSGAT